jgi:hypothetical protein
MSPEEALLTAPPSLSLLRGRRPPKCEVGRDLPWVWT